MAKVFKEPLLVAIDIGTTKICTLVGKVLSNDDIEIIAVATAPSDGLKKGVVVDIQKTVASIRKSVQEAEFISGYKIEQASIGVSGSHINSFNSHGAVPIKRKEVKSYDINNVLNAARAVSIPEGQQILHVIPQFYSVDSQDLVIDPMGMYGVRLESWVHIITGSIATVQNLIQCCHLAGVSVTDIVLEQLASAEAVLSKDERELGVALLDIGGGTSDFALYHHGALKHTFVIPSAGNHLTQDIAIGLHTSLQEAEHLKHNMNLVPAEQFNLFKNIVEARLNEILQIAFNQVANHNLSSYMSRGLVITGGGAMLEGIVDNALQVFNSNIRIGVPRLAYSLDIINHPMYATGYGLMLIALKEQQAPLNKINGPVIAKLFYRMKSWVTDFF